MRKLEEFVFEKLKVTKNSGEEYIKNGGDIFIDKKTV